LPGALMVAWSGALVLLGASFTAVPAFAVMGYLLLAARAAVLTHPPREARVRHA
jgi:hypothetical protein